MPDSSTRNQETVETVVDQSLFPGMQIEVGRDPAVIPVKDLTDAELTEEYNRCTISLKDWYERMNSRQQEILIEDPAYSDRILKDEQLRFITGESLKSDARARQIRFEKEYREAARDLGDQVWESVGKHLRQLDLDPNADFSGYLDLIKAGMVYVEEVRRQDAKLKYEDDDELLAYSPRYNYLFDNSVGKVMEAMAKRSDGWDKKQLLEGIADLAIDGYSPVSDNNFYSRLLIGDMVRVGGLDGLRAADTCLESIRSKRNDYFKDVIQAYNNGTDTGDDDFIEDGWDDDSAGSYSIIQHQRDDFYLGDRHYIDDDSLHSIHRHVCEVVKEITWIPDQIEDLSEHLVSLFKHDSSGTLDYYVAVFEKLGPESYKALLQGVNSTDKLTRITCENMLFDIELGEMDVEEGMVKIYGKMFHLVDDVARTKIVGKIVKARRLSPRGDWGAFDKEGAAKGIFKLGPEDFRGLENPEPKDVKLDIDLYSMIRSVCIPRADETPQMRLEREKVLASYLDNFSKVIDGFHDDTGVWLSSLELHEQALFILHLTSEADEWEIKNLKSVASRYGVKALSVYTALEYGSVGHEITDFLISPAVEEGFKEKVLDNYFSLTRRAYDWRSVFSATEKGKSFKFSDELYEAFTRKSTEYLRAAVMVEQGLKGEVARKELLDSMWQISYALEALKGLYEKPSSLKREILYRKVRHGEDKGKLAEIPNPQVCAEPLDPEGDMVVEDAMTSWALVDGRTGSRVVVSVRPRATQGGEARINFRVSNDKKGVEARIGVDLSDWGKVSGDLEKPYAVSLDLGTGKIDRASGVYPSQRVGNILQMVEGSEGGHTEKAFSAEAVGRFKDIAGAFTDYMENRYKSVRPTP